MTFALGLLLAAPALVAFLDAQRFDDRAWQRSGLSLLTWTLIIVLLPAFGPLTYVAIARPRLRRTVATT